MTDDLGIYVVIAFGVFWVFIAFCGFIMKMHDRFHNEHQH